jgi:ATP-binding cassette, subfamily B, multidrug efflux pump
MSDGRSTPTPPTGAKNGGGPAGSGPGFVGPRRGPGPGGPMGGHGGGVPGEKARDFKGTMRKLVGALGPHRVAVFFVMLIATASAVFMILGPKILGRATTTLFEGVMAGIAGTGGIDFAAIGRILLVVLALYLVSTAAGYTQGWIMAGISVKVTYQLRRDIAEKINRLPLRYFDGTSHGEVQSRIANDVDVINRSLSQTLTQIVTSITTVLGVLIMMFTISPLMTFVSLIVLPVSTAIIAAVIKRSQKYFRRQQEYLGHLTGHIEEMYGGHLVMRAFNGEKRSIEVFSRSNDTLYESAWKSQFFSGMMMPIMMFVGNLGYVAVSILGGWLAIRKVITVGDIQAFIQYVRSFTQPLAQIANMSNVLQQTAAAAERVFEFLAEPEQPPEADNPVRPTTVAGHVSFRDVVFGYTPDKTIIKGFSADAAPGAKIAIVGPTGAGKTTIVKLLMRYYDVDSGSILVDGHDIREYHREDLRRMFGMVLQDTWLFNGTIMENIRYGRPHATDDEVIEAAKVAHADHFIHTLPHGYEMVINEEAGNLSQGQMQLLTIARAVLADPRLLILDEATSSVDTLTEVLIQRAMDARMVGRTSFVIAHRLSTIRNADLILVLRDGDIVELGTHAALLGAGGFYADLYAGQFAVSAPAGSMPNDSAPAG